MKRNYKIILPIFFLAVLLLSFKIANKPDPEKDKILIGLIRYALTKGHYEPHQMDDDFSKNVFDEFVTAIDPFKRFFLQSDIDEFSNYRLLIDDQLKNEDLTFYNVVYERFKLRVEESKVYYKEILESPFDFDKEGTFNLDYDAKPFANNQAELIKRWQLQLKVSTLSRLNEKLDLQDSQIENDQTFEPKSFEELEESARVSTKKSLDELYVLMDELNETDWFSVYINTVTLQFDPHTNFYAPKDKKRFDQEMSGKPEGIGARLQKKEDYITNFQFTCSPCWPS